MPKIHVLLKKEELNSALLPGKVVIVLDILFATTTIVAALAHGASEVVPALDGAACLAEAQGRPPESYILAGELNAETLEGFAHPTPLALLHQDVGQRSVLYATTNGTVALKNSAGADHIYAAALLNARAIVTHVVQHHPDHTVLIVCSGSADNFNLEDFYGAGCLVSLFRILGGDRFEFNDAALAAEILHEQGNALQCLSQARVGRGMLTRKLDEEIHYAARQHCFDVVPKLIDGSLRPV